MLRSFLSLALPLVIAALCTCTVVAQEPSSPTEYRLQWFDVQHYDVTMRIADPASRQVSGMVRIAFVRLTKNLASFPLFYDGGTLDSVFMAGKRTTPVARTIPGTSVAYYEVPPPQGAITADVDTMVAYYSGVMTDEGGTAPWGGVHYNDNVLYALGVGFANASVSATQHWMPCYDHPSDKATLTLTATVPASVDVVSNGLRTANDVSAGTRTVTWKTSHPLATYLMTFAVAPYVQVHLHGADTVGTPIELYAQHADSSAAAASFGLLPRMVSTLARTYTSYPADKVGYCLTEKGAMEHMGMICYPASLARSRDTINDVAAHELAHQWFGGLVTPLDFRHAWLSESFATYSESMWRQSLGGNTSYLVSIAGKASQYINQISKAEGIFALYDFPRATPSSNYPQTIYQKGAVVLAMLRTYMGDSAFYQGLRHYLTQRAHQCSTTEELQQLLEASSQRSLQAFFTEWVYGTGWPQVSVTRYTADPPRYEIRQIQRNSHPSWPLFTTLPLNVRYQVTAGSVIKDTVLTFDDQGVLVIPAAVVLGVNAGTRCRSLVEVTSTTSVAETPQPGNPRSTISLYPNPARDSITLVVAGATTDSITYTIVGSDGSVVGKGALREGENQLAVASLASGAYTISVVQGGTVHTLPLTVLH